MVGIYRTDKGTIAILEWETFRFPDITVPLIY